MLADQIPRQITLRVVDDSGEPIQGAFAAGYSSNEGGGGEGITNDQGEITVTARRDFAFWVRSSKDGYYKTMGSIAWPPPDPLEIVLKRKIDPVAMVVGSVPDHNIPQVDAVLKYDVEKADWLPPFGSGQNADVYFRAKEPFFSEPGPYRAAQWELIVEMWVENPEDGFILFERPEANSPAIASELASPQEAPLTGYDQKVLSQENTRRDGRQIAQAVDAKRTLVVFRVRTELDERGEVVSAHYGKIYEPMSIAPGGNEGTPFLGNIFYFNPTPNNRSLEYNKENLNSHQSSRRFPY